MYLEHFKLEKKPFEQTPDSEFLYLSEQHSYALASMKFAVANHDAIAIITGAVGSGKTTLLNTVLAEMADNIAVARVFNTQLSDTEILQSILAEFGIKAFRKKKAELLYELRRFVEQQYDEDRQVVLLIDEAQNLSERVLEELRMLTSIETEKQKLVTILLLGQPELGEKIDARSMEQLRQRCRLRLHIKPLNEEETEQYMRHRIDVAGGDYDQIFEEEVAELVYRLSQGVPRLINTLCDTALTACLVKDHRKVNCDIVTNVLEELHWSFDDGRGQSVDTLTRGIGPSLQLRVEENGQFLFERTLLEGGSVIGRAKDCALHVDSSYLSKYHALFSREGVVWSVTDLNSTNGTVVANRRVHSHIINDGDVIYMGTCRISCSLLGSEDNDTATNRVQSEDEDDTQSQKLGKSGIHAVK